MRTLVMNSRVNWSVVLLIAGVLSLQGVALAQETDQWLPPQPDPDHPNGWDWIQLTSGEWLGGELLLLHDDKLEFDSDELDVLEFDFEDVAVIRSPRIMTFGFLDKTTVTGTAILRDDVLVVQTAQGVREYPRANLLSIIAGEPSEWNYWSTKIGAGYVVRSGNTDQSDFNTTALIRRQTTKTRLDFNYLGNFAKVDSVETVNNHRLTAKFDYIISRTFFITPVTGELYTNKFQNIDLRSLIGAGLGVDLVDRSGLEWFVQLGAGYQDTRYVSVQPGAEESESSAAIIPATSLDWEITNDIDFLLDLSAQITVPDTDGTVYHAYGLLSFELTSILDFDVGVTWDRVQNPTEDAEGNVPEKNDIRTSFGLSVDF
jgi:putative salt-induced outer membrane protein YdiY